MPKRSEYMVVRFTPSELRDVKRAAKKSKVPISSWMRHVAVVAASGVREKR